MSKIAIMVDEELPCVEFGFGFLQVKKIIEVDESPSEPVPGCVYTRTILARKIQ